MKTNFGHTEAAAGMAGLIKALLALRNAAIPPSLHFNEPNPQSHGLTCLLLFRAKLHRGLAEHDGPTDCRSDRFRHCGNECPCRAGGSTEQTVLPEEAFKVRRWHLLLPLSAKSPSALRALAARFADLLESRTQI